MLLENGTWSLADYEPIMKVLPCKYVIKIKEMKTKVQLVALGCLQMLRVDYNSTFAPVVTIVTIRPIFAIAAALNVAVFENDRLNLLWIVKLII